jgi:Ca2+/Na+ antiporter
MSGHGVHHHTDHPEQKRVGIFIAVLAVIMAVVAAATTQQANQMLFKAVKASNGFAWYQSKRQRSYANQLELQRIDFELAGTPTDAQKKLLEAEKTKLAAKNAEYEGENKEILATAQSDDVEATTASHRHHWFEFAEIGLHIAVVLCSLVLLTDQKLFLRLGVGATILGVVLAGYAQFGNHEHAEHAGGEKPAAAGAPAHH